MSTYRTALGLCATLGFAACSQAPLPDVAQQYKSQFGPAETSRFTPCPELNGVWNLREPSGGSTSDTEGKWLKDYPLPHFRWSGVYILGLSPWMAGVIAARPQLGGTTVFFAPKPYTEVNPVPPGERRNLSFSERTDKELPCVGVGWRRAAAHDHSANDAAARVLKLDAQKARSITQTDYVAITGAGELLLGMHIRYQGSRENGEPVSDAYWHFLKLPRIAKDAKAAGFLSH